MKNIPVEILGPVDYDTALKLQLKEKANVLEGKSPGKIFILTHDPPVITLGRNANSSNLKVTEETLTGKGYQLRSSSRGGDITVHEPGQVVVYFILPLPSKMAGVFIKNIVDLIIQFLSQYSLNSCYDQKNPGIWVKEQKICSIGFDLTGGVSMHGIALNVSNTLEGFNLVNPCGITDKDITSLSKELGYEIHYKECIDNLVRFFKNSIF